MLSANMAKRIDSWIDSWLDDSVDDVDDDDDDDDDICLPACPTIWSQRPVWRYQRWHQLVGTAWSSVWREFGKFHTVL